MSHLGGHHFFRTKTSGPRACLQVVENRWEGGRSRQRIAATLGRLDQLQESGQLDGLLASGARLARSVLLGSAQAQGRLPTISVRRIGPALVVQRLWQQTGCQQIIQQRLQGRHVELPMERTLFLTVLHRLFDPGSDRAADKGKESHKIDRCDDLQLYHLYRAMSWLGDQWPRAEQADKIPFAPRCTKNLIGESLLAQRRDLLTHLQLVLLDTTSISFEGKGGETIGQRGPSKDHRPDLKQMIVGAVLDGQGRPMGCALWPGNTADVTTLIPVVDRLRSRFGVTQAGIVADRGMISQETIEALENQQRGWQYILGARMRSQNEVKAEVLARAGRFRVVHPECPTKHDPAPLKLQEVWVENRRYIACLNEDEARKDAADRDTIVASLREKLRSDAKSLVGNEGYRRYLRATGLDHFQVDEAKIEEEARDDGKWVLRTNTDLDPAEIALQFKRFGMVEAWLRSCQSRWQTGPIDHQCDATIRGHVFCWFLALVLRQELEAGLARDGHDVEWADVIPDLDRLPMVEVEQDGKRFLRRSELQGTCGTVLRAAGVAVPPTAQQAAAAPDPGATPRM